MAGTRPGTWEDSRAGTWPDSKMSTGRGIRAGRGDTVEERPGLGYSTSATGDRAAATLRGPGPAASLQP